jgi:hypothetical protein
MLPKVIPADPEKKGKIANHERSLIEELFDQYK